VQKRATDDLPDRRGATAGSVPRDAVDHDGRMAIV
jgi:hypothetical protein